MVWQDFPMYSSGLDNYPPTDPAVIVEMSKVARHYVQRLHSHASLIVWCGGNELYEMGDGRPVTNTHPMIKMLEEVCKIGDPDKRFIAGSPSGPNIWGGRDNFGKKINWETHGPWTLQYNKQKEDYCMQSTKDYWQQNDALLNSEVGLSGSSSVEILQKYSGGINPFPANNENALWKQFCFWTDWDEYLRSHNNQTPPDLTTYVEWSQQKQAEGLSIAVKSCKDRFPESGGIFIWMGHDSYPTTANTSIIDFDGNQKKAAIAVSKIWLEKQNKY